MCMPQSMEQSVHEDCIDIVSYDFSAENILIKTCDIWQEPCYYVKKN